MSRQIRRVPPNWEHPRNKDGKYKPMYDQVYCAVAQEWLNNCILWSRGKHPDQHGEYASTLPFFWEWDGGPPDEEYYRPAFNVEPTWYQGYEDVSEGTPFTPAFETKAELVDWLVANGDPVFGAITKEQAESFIDQEWAPSMIMTVDESGANIKGGIQAL